MFAWFRDRLLRVLRVPPEPHDPIGGSTLVFRAGEGYFHYRIAVWVLGRVLLLAVAGYLAFVLVLVATAVAAQVAPAASAAAKKSLFAKVDPDVLQWVVVGVGGFVLLLYLVQSAISWALLRLDYEMRWYKVTDRSLRIREGVWFVREMTMSFANVQNVAIEQGPIQKYFGVADLLVQSAGGGGGEKGQNQHVGVFRGIEHADRVKEMILERLRKHRDAGLGDTDDRSHAAPSREVAMVEAMCEVRDETRALRAAVTAPDRMDREPARQG
ncbi:MAG: PH domain-containing protein [Deltaproteobacteria bacterium]|nr:PH domain-containing protein [Deltaproteobacteria bacterium]